MEESCARARARAHAHEHSQRLREPKPSQAHAQGFLDTSPEQLQQVVETNLLGTLLCSRRALQLMAAQPRGGHVFNLDGAGADGLPTPCYAAYGATKAGLHIWHAYDIPILQHSVTCQVQ